LQNVRLSSRSSPASFEPNTTAVSWKTVEQGAATSVLLADEFEGKTALITGGGTGIGRA
jgi:hypothetical protein